VAHISRKELRKDEFAETLAHGAEVALSHQRLFWTIGAVALAAVLLVLGWRLYSERQTVKASAEFDEVMKVFEARIRAVGEAQEPGEITYVAEKNKYEDAAQKFAQVTRRYPYTRPGQLARYYAALSLERVGRDAEAQKWLQELAGSGSAEFAALARFRLASLYARTGKGAEAVKLYQQLQAKPTVLVPKPLVLFALADYNRTTNPQEAIRLYNQIKTEFRDSAIAEEANKRLENLNPKL